MIIRGLLIAAASLLLCDATVAQTVSAKVDWYGTYTVSKTQEIADPTSPTGKRYVSTPVAPSSNTDSIPGTPGIRFGFSYVLSGKSGGTETVKHVYRFPPPGMPDKVAGGTRSTYERDRQDKIGEHVMVGWSFEGAPPERILLGDWSVEVWQGGRKLVEKRFNVHKP